MTSQSYPNPTKRPNLKHSSKRYFQQQQCCQNLKHSQKIKTKNGFEDVGASSSILNEIEPGLYSLPSELGLEAQTEAFSGLTPANEPNSFLINSAATPTAVQMRQPFVGKHEGPDESNHSGKHEYSSSHGNQRMEPDEDRSTFAPYIDAGASAGAGTGDGADAGADASASAGAGAETGAGAGLLSSD